MVVDQAGCGSSGNGGSGGTADIDAEVLRCAFEDRIIDCSDADRLLSFSWIKRARLVESGRVVEAALSGPCSGAVSRGIPEGNGAGRDFAESDREHGIRAFSHRGGVGNRQCGWCYGNVIDV